MAGINRRVLIALTLVGVVLLGIFILNQTGLISITGQAVAEPPGDDLPEVDISEPEDDITLQVNEEEEPEEEKKTGGYQIQEALEEDEEPGSGGGGEEQISVNNPPTHEVPLILSSSGLNRTNDNITAYNQSTNDLDGDRVKNFYQWSVNSESFEVVNLPFEGGSNGLTTKDYSSHSFTPVIENAIYSSTDGYDGFGAYEFDGTDSKISLGKIGNSIDGDGMTLSVWVRTDDAGLDMQTLYQDGYVLNGVTLRYRAPFTHPWQCLIGNDAENVISVAGPAVPYTVNAEEWNHIVCSYDGQELKIYINGVLQDTLAEDNGNIWDNDRDATIGSANIQGNRGFNRWDGMIDDFRLYNRALSDEQIALLYEGETNVIHSSMTSAGDTWMVEVTPNDGIEDGETLSGTLDVLNSPPSLHSIVINSTDGTNLTNENIFLWGEDITDADNDPVWLIYNWNRGEDKLSVLNMPFTMVNGTNVKNSHDYSGEGNHGDVYGPEWDDGWLGSGSYTFDGEDDYIEIADSTIEDLTETSFTAFARFKKFPSSGPGTILSQAGGEDWIMIDDSSVCSDDEIYTTIGDAVLCSGFVPDDNVWYTVTVKQKKTEVLIFVDGEEVASRFATIKTGDVTGSIYIGKDSNGESHFEGVIDEVQIFNVSITDQQIKLFDANAGWVIHNTITGPGYTYTGTIIVNDGYEDGDIMSADISILDLGFSKL